ncbi:MAG: hypothetical protein AAFP13_09620 [Pseudomonadota bacterium]
MERLDGSSKAANGDLIAIKGSKRPIIQVKSALSWDRPSFGHATRFLRDGTRFFNEKNAPVFADFLVTVVSDPDEPIIHVIPIDTAEELAQRKAKLWMETPTRSGETRSPNFPVSLQKDDPELVEYLSSWHLLEN